MDDLGRELYRKNEKRYRDHELVPWVLKFAYERGYFDEVLRCNQALREADLEQYCYQGERK